MMRRSLTSLTSSISKERPAESSFLYAGLCMRPIIERIGLTRLWISPKMSALKLSGKYQIAEGYMKKFALLTAACLLAAAWAQESKPTAKPAAAGAKYWNTDQGKWSDPGMAGVHTMSVSGDPAKGPSVQYLKVDPGAAVGWHWHTPAETLMGDSGT